MKYCSLRGVFDDMDDICQACNNDCNVMDIYIDLGSKDETEDNK